MIVCKSKIIFKKHLTKTSRISSHKCTQETKKILLDAQYILVITQHERIKDQRKHQEDEHDERQPDTQSALNVLM